MQLLLPLLWLDVGICLLGIGLLALSFYCCESTVVPIVLPITWLVQLLEASLKTLLSGGHNGLCLLSPSCTAGGLCMIFSPPTMKAS